MKTRIKVVEKPNGITFYYPQVRIYNNFWFSLIRILIGIANIGAYLYLDYTLVAIQYKYLYKAYGQIFTGIDDRGIYIASRQDAEEIIELYKQKLAAKKHKNKLKNRVKMKPVTEPDKITYIYP